MEKVLMWRNQGDTEWLEFIIGKKLDVEKFEIGKIYTYEYKVIEREKS